MAGDTMFAEERKLNIVEYIQSNKKATVPELCETFDVSSATIRNDLRDLEQSGLILRTHGGAMVKSKTGFELTDKQKKAFNLKEKQKIAETALSFVEDGDTVLLDTGTTTAELARLLYMRAELTVVTNDYNIAAVVEEFEGINMILMGGIIRKGFHCTVGIAGRTMLSGLSVDKAFMAANSFSIENGASTPDINHAETKKEMISIASKVILLCDSSKWGKSSFARFAGPDELDVIITDFISETDKVRLEEYGTEVIV